jgi:hypothetical protein
LSWARAQVAHDATIAATRIALIRVIFDLPGATSQS